MVMFSDASKPLCFLSPILEAIICVSSTPGGLSPFNVDRLPIPLRPYHGTGSFIHPENIDSGP